MRACPVLQARTIPPGSSPDMEPAAAGAIEKKRKREEEEEEDRIERREDRDEMR